MKVIEKYIGLAPAKRVALLALLTCSLILIASTLNGLSFALLHRQEFVAQFPGSVGVFYWAQLGVAVMGLAATIGIVLLWRPAPWIFLTVSIMVVPLDFLTGAPRLHVFAAMTSSIVVLALSYANRALFSIGGDVAAETS
jgi:hypothetical protein